jgi:hypothetical protein
VLALGRGPVVFGLDWHSGMNNPDAQGWLHVTGPMLGGHCLIGRGARLVWRADAGAKPYLQPDWFDRLDLLRSYTLLHNSWGRGWGVDGTAKLSLQDVATLLAAGGDACLPVRLPVSRQG